MLGTHHTNPRQRQFLEEASNLNGLELSILSSRSNHRVKSILHTCKNLGVTLEDGQDLRVRLLKHTDGFGQPLGPVGKARAVMWSAQEHNPMSAVEHLLKMPFRSLLC